MLPLGTFTLEWARLTSKSFHTFLGVRGWNSKGALGGSLRMYECKPSSIKFETSGLYPSNFSGKYTHADSVRRAH